MILALDIGGTKLAAGWVDSGGGLIRTVRTPTPSRGDAESLFAVVTDLLAPLLAGSVGIGVGCGGPIHRDLVSPLNIEQWRGFPLRARLEEWSGLPVAVDNDAKALAAGEVWCGSLRGKRSAMAMVVSTGVGGGLVVDGRVLDGLDGNAGHIGHVIVEPDGRPCACGARGCLEAEIAGPQLAEQAGGPPPFPDWLVSRAGRLLGRAITSAAALLDLEAVAVGGGVGEGLGEALLAPARAEAAASFRIFGRSVEIVPVSAGGLVGAAAVFRARFAELAAQTRRC